VIGRFAPITLYRPAGSESGFCAAAMVLLRVVYGGGRRATGEASDGTRFASITLGTRLSQILVAWRIVEAILDVCQEMKVACSAQ
jgi:hypothetical protein